MFGIFFGNVVCRLKEQTDCFLQPYLMYSPHSYYYRRIDIRRGGAENFLKSDLSTNSSVAQPNFG